MKGTQTKISLSRQDRGSFRSSKKPSKPESPLEKPPEIVRGFSSRQVSGNGRKGIKERETQP